MRPQILNPATLASLFRAELELCNVRPGETITVLSDLASRREYVSAAFAAAHALGADIYGMCVNAAPSWDRLGAATAGRCKGAGEAVKGSDLLICSPDPLFTKWSGECRCSG